MYCPPGASCTVVESIEDSDYCILVTEPTPFGLHDLKVAAKLVKKMKIPFGVVLNKATKDNIFVQNFCEKNNIDILMEVPYSKELAKAYSNGVLPVQLKNEYKEEFVNVYKKKIKEVLKR